MLAESGRHGEALACYERVVQLRPDSVDGWHNRGNALRRLGRLEESLGCYEQALRLQPRHGNSQHNLGLALLALGRPQQAAERFRQTLRCRPDHPDALANLGVALYEQGLVVEAAAVYRQALAGNPQAAGTHNNLGVALMELGQVCEAIECYREALRLEPGYADAHSNLGNALREQGHFDAALDELQQAVTINPRAANSWNNLGIVFARLGRGTEALRAYDQAIRHNPNHADAHTNRAYALLQAGEFERGWEEYEWRWKCPKVGKRKFEQPKWDGSPLNGQTILLHAEQGLGDTLQFVRFAPLVQQRGGRVVVEAQPALAPLLKRCGGIDQVVAQGAALPPFSVQVPLLSLPRLFGVTVDSIPDTVPYLCADPDLVQQWSERLQVVPGFRIAIAWQGNPNYREDRYRSIPLKHFRALSQVEGVTLVSVQKGFGREQLADGAEWVHDPGANLDDNGAFLDTAAILKCVDLVVTSDTAVAHLAGGLGVPVWVVLGKISDWRWLRERIDSPWYPNMRLFRQRSLGDWDEVFARVAEQLRQEHDRAAGTNTGARGSSHTTGPFVEQAGCRLPRVETSHGWQEQASRLFYEPGVVAFRKQAEALARANSLAAATALLRQTLEVEPNAATWNNLGVLLGKQGELNEAIEAFRQALRVDVQRSDAHHNLGEALQRQGKSHEAIQAFEAALQIDPTVARTHLSLGTVWASQGDHTRACVHYRRALELRPDWRAIHARLAAALDKQGDWKQAALHFQKAHEGKHANAEGFLRQGEERLGQKGVAEAIACFRLAVSIDSECVAGYKGLGIGLFRVGEYKEAAKAFETALERQPDHGLCWQGLGDALRKLGRSAEAESCYRRALQQLPNSSQLHNTLGITLIDQGRPREAEECFRTSIRLQQDHASAHNNLGVSVEQQGRLEDAIACYQMSLRHNDADAETHRNLALAWLSSGEFERGWKEYEWRWKCPKVGKRKFEQPKWDGSPLNGQTILLHAEQGLGDTLQFIRFAPLVQQRGGRVVVEAQPALVPLLKRCGGIDQVVAQGAPLPPFSVQVPLLSLPRLFGVTVERIPDAVPYLCADPALVQQWSELLQGVPGFKIAIAWQGNPNYQGDRHRSVPLRHFRTLAQLEGVRLVSIQKGFGRQQLKEVGNWGIIDVGEELDEKTGAFMDTAAVLSSVDLVVTSDTAVAHLAGGLGVAVWVVLSQASDWRWLRERNDSPWYPSVRLFRQRSLGDWDEVFARVADAVEQHRSRPRLREPLLVEVSPGELLDKISILEIKRSRIAEPSKLANIHTELGVLQGTRVRSLQETADLTDLVGELKRVNEQLWDVEDSLRTHEQERRFDGGFIDLARSVYHLNDRRALVKRQINEMCGSALIEEKSYGSAEAGR